MTLGDLLRPATLPDKLAEARRHYEQVLRGAGRTPEVDWERVIADLAAFGERHRSRITDVSLVLHRQMTQGYSVLFEGAQAALLDLDHGTYPYVTCSAAAAGGAATGTGVPPTRIDGVLGVAKAYCTRVGTGPFPTELQGDLAHALRERGGEYGATTGRPRRCGFFDAVAVRYAVRLNGFDTLAITKLDVLDELDEISVCTGYRFEGALLEEMPADSRVLEACEPVYETLPGGARGASVRASGATCPRTRAATWSGWASSPTSRSASSRPAPIARRRSCAPRVRSRAGSNEGAARPRVLPSTLTGARP